MRNPEVARMIEALMLLRKDYSDMTLTQAIILLKFSEDPELMLADAARAVDTTPATISRILDKLSDGKTGTLKSKGLNYVRLDRGKFADDRRIAVTLTKQGKEVCDKLSTLLKR